ncbi:MAG: hypothetical protein M3N98_16035, partial [Actinomycetota bacterium]|nr:hypothetical protein [Actinomycetota bacterium]
MASEIIAAIDETAANILLHGAEAARGTLPAPPGSQSFGPFVVGWTASASINGGTVTLGPPDRVSIDDINLNYSLSLSVGIDLSFLDFCLPRVCFKTPFGRICTPKLCFSFPAKTVSIPFSSSATISADFGIKVNLTGTMWNVDVVIERVRKLDLGAAATILLTAILATVSAALAAIPFIGLVLSLVLGLLTAAFGLAQVTGLLGQIVSLFVAGLTFNIYQQPQLFPMLPAAGPFDPAVFVTLASVGA